MASRPSIPDHSAQSRAHGTSYHIISAIKPLLIGILGLLSVFLFGVSLDHKNVLGLWIGFICALISGFFVQCLINRNKTER